MSPTSSSAASSSSSPTSVVGKEPITTASVMKVGGGELNGHLSPIGKDNNNNKTKQSISTHHHHRHHGIAGHMTHAELLAKEFFTAGAAGVESVIPLPHRGASYTKVIMDDDDLDDDDDDFNDNNRRRQHKTNNNSIEIGDVEYGHNGALKDDDDEDIPDRSLCHLFGINAFAFAYGILIATFGLITLPTESEKLWPEKHAVLLAIFLGICGISQLSGPIAGFFSDRCTSQAGRRRPFLFYSSLVGIPSLYMLRVASHRNDLAMYLIFFFLAMLALNVMYVAYSGALTDLVNENQRGMANGLMGAFTVLGASIGFGCFSFFLDIQSGYIFYLVVLSTSVIISMVTFTERPIQPTPDIMTWTWEQIGESYWVSPVEHRDFFLVFVSRTFYYMGVSVQTFMLFYFRDVIDSIDPKQDVAYLALVGQMTGAIVCVPMGLLSNKIGRKALIYISSAFIIATYSLFMMARTREFAILIGAIYGIGNGTYLSVDYALACDTLPSKDNAARYLGIWGVGAFIGTLLGPMLVGPALLWFGTGSGRVDDNGMPMYDIQGYYVILIIGILCIFAGAATVIPIRSAK